MRMPVRIAAVVAALSALAACASPLAHQPPASGQSASAHVPECLTGTGSRIPVAPGECMAIGRSYSAAEVDNTGKSNAGAALGLLDPSITAPH